MIERCGSFLVDVGVADADVAESGDLGIGTACLSVWSVCSGNVGGVRFNGDAVRLPIEFEGALFVDTAEYVDFNVLWLAVGLKVKQNKLASHSSWSLYTYSNM